MRITSSASTICAASTRCSAGPSRAMRIERRGTRSAASSHTSSKGRSRRAEAFGLVEGVEILVLDALRDEPHETHFTVAEALAIVERIAPRRTYFTHMTHDLPHAKTNARLPEGVELAYDGLVLDIEVVVS